MLKVRIAAMTLKKTIKDIVYVQKMQVRIDYYILFCMQETQAEK